jgi:cytochrome c553
MCNRLFLSIPGLMLAFSALAQDAAPAPPAATEPSAAAPAAVAEASPAPAAAVPAVVGPGDPVAGQAKAMVCAACHGMDGNAVDPQYPKLAAQHEHYIARQLALFKSGERVNAIMMAFAVGLQPQDMRDIGAWYASQKASVGVASDELIPGREETFKARGQRLFRGGDPARGIPACMACHGPAGTGNPGSAYPHLGGQHTNYTKAKLIAFRGGEAWGRDANANQIMTMIAANLDDDDIEALSSYIEGLHQAPPAAESAAAR